MKKIILLSTIAASALFATNGDNMAGLSVETRALGGTGIAMYSGAENALSNPALLGQMKNDFEFTFGGTVFNADVGITTTMGNVDDTSKGVDMTSAEGMSVIPSVSIGHKITRELTFALGMYGTAGMGTDWRGSDVNAAAGEVDLYNMRSSLMLMQFAPSLAYHKDNFGVGVTAIMQYGALSIDYDTTDTSGNLKHVGNGMSNDFGYGFQLGGYINPISALTVAAIYKSSIDMEYKDQISAAAAAFGYGSNANALEAKTDHLEQPEEIGFGVSFDNTNMTYTADARSIKWSKAQGYKDFGWEDQTVLAIGARYKTNKYWLGMGLNSANNPVPNNTSDTEVATGLQDTDGGADHMNTDGDTMNLFNYAMFPATITKMIGIGGGYNASKNVTLNFAYTLAPEVTDTVSATTVGVGDITTKHSQTATSFSVKYSF